MRTRKPPKKTRKVRAGAKQKPTVPKEDDKVEWKQPGDPDWVEMFLALVRQGVTDKLAIAVVGRDESTQKLWRAKNPINSLRHTRAKREGSVRRKVQVNHALDELIAKLSPWGISKGFARDDPETWKSMEKVRREADPNAHSLTITGGMDGQIQFSELLDAAGDGFKTKKAKKKGKGKK